MLMMIWSTTLTILGLMIFEIVNSPDNAVINASILETIKDPRARRFFVTWGMFFSVFLVRGLLPFLIYYIPNSGLGFSAAVSEFWNGNPNVMTTVRENIPLLLIPGGLFLTLLFLHWLFVEDKDVCAYRLEGLFQNIGSIWFNASALVMLIAILVLIKTCVAPPERAGNMMLAAAIGIAVFFISDGFKQNAEAAEKKLGTSESDWAKVWLLEVIDTTFSTDGVVGAFAFTTNVVLILVGNGIGAYIVRRLTLSGSKWLSKYALIKNGAMYAIGCLGVVMIMEGFDVPIPKWISPLATFAIVGLFLWRSVVENRKAKTLALA